MCAFQIASASTTSSDRDNDLLTAQEEAWLGTKPNNPDTDGDGIPDGVEFSYRLDPLDPSDANQDMDGDGSSNLEEYLANTDPSDPADAPATADSEPVTTEPEPAPEPAANALTLSWTAPLQRTDGSSISLAEIDHFGMRYGQDPASQDQSMTAPSDATSAEISDLAAGTWYFSMRVIDSSGLQSVFSEPVEHIIE
ncbi:fibronectin type III domain-containing protein [Marinobacter changyiensis]|uniref:fibronectin type III domain-containing protein n=1 Tax=Marinobacter changyiensis TaxID=2604091 RepID=UPI00126450BF|nr:fibronectin type III domain-containing protein [Marinobacter changyiensis]